MIILYLAINFLLIII